MTGNNTEREAADQTGVYFSQCMARLRAGMVCAAGVIWALPITLFGLLVGLPVALSRNGRLTTVRHATPALLITGPLADRLLDWHPLGNIIGVSIGHVVIARESYLTDRLLEHELAHVRQAARWGPLFPIAYLASSLHQLCCGKRAYYDNVFEVEARAAEVLAPVAGRHGGKKLEGIQTAPSNTQREAGTDSG